MGDNNNGIADRHIISNGDIVGKYTGHLKKAGKVMDFLSSSTGFLIVIVIPMLLFFIYQVYNLIMISIRLKKVMAVEAAKEAAAQAEEENKAKNSDVEAARAALEEAKRMREEAESIRAQAQQELEEAKKSQNNKQDAE